MGNIMDEKNRSDEARKIDGLDDLGGPTFDLDRFQQILSHDLQAPIRRIIGIGQIALENENIANEEKSRTFLNMIVTEAEKMNKMLPELLKLSQIALKKLDLGDVSLSKIFEEVALERRSDMEAGKIEVLVKPGIVARADGKLVRIAFRELVDNAIKLSDVERPLRIEFGNCPMGDHEVFFVKDNGIGFDENYNEKIFMPFNKPQLGDKVGEGMGLSYVAVIIHRHNGHVWVRSQQGIGTTFLFTIGNDEGQ